MMQARSHRSYWAFMGHRISGLLLAVFLPFHFLVLGLALEGADRFDRFLALTEMPLVKAAEAGLVVLLAAHLLFGLRLLVLELLPWPGPRYARAHWITWGAGAALGVGAIFLIGAM